MDKSKIQNPKSKIDSSISHHPSAPAPLIGITVDALPDPSDARTQGKLQLNWNYAQSVADAGGVPLLIPPMADMEVVARLIDGWLIPGGLDIDAAYWGEENHPTVKLMASERHEADRRLYSCIDPELPIFGICYGCQFLNVVRGGSLIQHLPDVVGNESHADGGQEQICIEADSKLGSLVGPSSRALSYHHQAVGRLGEGLRQNASHSDGTVEGIEATDRPWVVGVQWHPERTIEDEESRRLFAALIEQARAFKAKRSRS
jgi:putative glutamine amidotransferase